MANTDSSGLMQHPILSVKIGGAAVEKLPSEFALATEGALHSVQARLTYPMGADVGSVGDTAAVSLFNRDSESLLFTGHIADIGVNWAYRELFLSDGCQDLCETLTTPAYRKEKASVILQDTLDAAGIAETSITCPEVELARFSTDETNAERCIEQLVKALGEHGFTGLRWFFDEKNVFHFGTLADTGKNEGELFAFESGSNIFRSGADYCGRWIEVLLLPIRHSRKITIDGTEVLTLRTAMRVSARHARLKIWYEGAV